MDTKNPQPQDPVQVPIQPASPAADTSQQPAQPQPVSISGGNKEHGPIGGNVSEYVTPHHTEAAPQLPPEVVDAGVEAVGNQEQPNLPEEVKNAGVQAAKETVPVTITDQPVAQPAPAQPLPTPMNYVEAKKEITGNPNNSKTWLGMLSKYVLEKFGMQNSV